MTFIDVDPEAVIGAGRATAATSGEWEAWAGHADSLLRDLSGGARDGVVSAAFESYLSDWNPTIKGIARQATALGLNAAGAAGSVVEGDGTGARALHQTGATLDGLATRLSRPINF